MLMPSMSLKSTGSLNLASPFPLKSLLLISFPFFEPAVKFIFTNVEPQDPDRVFSFSVRHDKATNLWAIVECNPRVEASANLVEALNQSNEFSWFVRSMHREFEG
jgi:hypothetical protein